MRFKKHLEFEYGFKNIEIIALANILFLLLLFFICVFNFVAEPGIRTVLGQVISGKSLMRGNIEISIVDNNITVNGRKLNEEELNGMLKFAASHKQTVLIKTAQGVSLERVIGIMNKCRNFGVRQVNIVTQK